VSPPRTAAAAPDAAWRDYWSRDELWGESELWRENAALFLRRVARHVPFGPQDSVLDVGCGPGHLADLLAPRVASVHGVDVAPAFLRACRERCRRHGNVTTALLGEDYTRLEGTGGPFTRILCVSVVQYYREPGEVTRLIASARSVAAPGALMLIADLPRTRGPAGFLWDGLCSVALAAGGGYLPALLGAARGRWAGGSRYAAVARSAGQLSFTPAGALALARGLGVRATLVRRGRSVYANRPSLLVEFPGRQ